jgi:hypothetical protein
VTAKARYQQRARSLEAILDVADGQSTGDDRVECPAPRSGVKLSAAA